MEHIEIFVRNKEANGHYAITNKEGIQGETFYEEMQTLERAEHFVKCWNNFDTLLKACEGAVRLKALILPKGHLVKEEHADEARALLKMCDSLEQAIAKAGE